ncbi:MAG: ABC-F family ATP-binding cassette domain-containing protein [Myxococcales bacterium]|nr:ABC-F family ATP-binding cassette domain-containing protein [Myxococcales bacterium]
MAVLIAEDIELSWGDRHVLTGADLRVDERDRLGLVGPNGCGKSTLLGILAGSSRADAGQVRRAGRLALLSQDPTFVGTVVEDVVQRALAWHVELQEGYEAALAAGDLEKAAELQDRLDAEGWVVEHRIDALLTQTGAPGRDRLLSELSGGERRRLALAATLLEQPDVLLLDEPTNHLDAATIAWLEKYLMGYRGAVVMVTHDRYLLEAVCERIVEIEHGKTVGYDGSYADYLIARAERQALLHKLEDRRLRILARESAWAARSPAARSTKQKARLQRLDVLKEQGRLPRERELELDFSTGLKTSGTVLEAHGLTLAFGDRTLLRKLDLALRPGERIGVLGPNGIGKSTLLKVLSGELEPDAGVVHKAPRVRIGVLDQARTGLKADDTVFEAAGGGNDQVQVGDRWVHVATFLERMLFGREQFDARVHGLSGGERARLLLAKKMLEGNAVLLLDEPTNDLDLWTLRVLEEALLAYDGAALIVTHDRAFLDRVCTGVLAFEGDGRATRYADRVQAERAAEARQVESRAVEVAPEPVKAPVKPATTKKLTYRESQELEGLPDAIEVAEARVGELEAVLADPATYRERSAELASIQADLEGANAEVERLYARWEALSERA